MIRLAVPLLLLAACKAPPEAPTELEDLTAFLFAHIDDDDDEALVAGLENLAPWLDDNLEATLEGYQIDALDQDAVNALDERDRFVDGLVGASVATSHAFDIEPVVAAIAVEDWALILGDNYDVYERDFLTDPLCFPPIDCQRLDASSYSESSWAGLVKVISRNDIQFRWVETQLGWMMVHRSWLVEPADISWNEIKVDAQYFLSVVLPDGNNAVRLQATWIDASYGILPVGENYAKQEIIRGMQKQGERVEEWLAEN
jgi:hypothetical protein